MQLRKQPPPAAFGNMSHSGGASPSRLVQPRNVWLKYVTFGVLSNSPAGIDVSAVQSRNVWRRLVIPLTLEIFPVSVIRAAPRHQKQVLDVERRRFLSNSELIGRLNNAQKNRFVVTAHTESTLHNPNSHSRRTCESTTIILLRGEGRFQVEINGIPVSKELAFEAWELCRAMGERKQTVTAQARGRGSCKRKRRS